MLDVGDGAGYKIIQIVGGFFMWLLLLIAVAVVIYLVIKSVNKLGQKASSPSDILRSRYSRGEINRNEYEQMKKNLE